MAAAAVGAEVDPRQFCPADQRILLSSTVWKLNSDGDPKELEHWLKRSMWLTSAGGLFYYSQKHKRHLGRRLGGIRLQPVQYFDHLFGFEVHLPSMGGVEMRPTVLATETAEEREEWMRHLTSFQGEAEETDQLSPLDVFGRAVPVVRNRRVSVRPNDAAGVAAFISAASWKEADAPVGGSIPRPLPDADASARSRRSSQACFADKAHTVLILDWDDTIFPTTWVREDSEMNWKFTIDAQLEPGPRRTLIKGLLARLFEAADEFMKTCMSMATVYLVTLSRRPWVDTSARNFLPGLGKIIKDNNIKVIYAQEYLTDDMNREYAHGDEFRSSEEVAAFYTRVKGTAMKAEVDKYHKATGISWKNFISMGDSDFERYGAMQAGQEAIAEATAGGRLTATGATAEGVDKDGKKHKLRTKTVKMLGEPTVEELTAELKLLTMWLQHMIRNEDGFDLEIDNTDDDAMLNKMHEDITGERAELRWAKLAGMEG